MNTMHKKSKKIIACVRIEMGRGDVFFGSADDVAHDDIIVAKSGDHIDQEWRDNFYQKMESQRPFLSKADVFKAIIKAHISP